MRILLLFLVVAAAACSRERDVAATTTTIVIDEPERAAGPALAVRRVQPARERTAAGQPVSIAVELEKPRPSQRVSVEWYGPDGWLDAYETHDADKARFTAVAPPRLLTKPGRYRAVVRWKGRPLAETGFTIE